MSIAVEFIIRDIPIPLLYETNKPQKEMDNRWNKFVRLKHAEAQNYECITNRVQ